MNNIKTQLRIRILSLFIGLFIGLNMYGQNFTLPSDGNWYLVATAAGRHAYIEYLYTHTTAHNPSIAKGEIQFINSKTVLRQKNQSMGYASWNQPQFAIINKGGVSELWVKAKTGVNSGLFEIVNSKYTSLRLGDTNDSNLADNGGSLKIYERLPPNAHFYTGHLNVMDGNVGIGTTSTDSKLSVVGQIHSQEVKVDLNGAVAPDYVFEKNYYLTPIAEVEQFINTEGHLPKIPSAEELERDGLNLKEMNLKLLEKIEELTLYIIEQNRELKSVNQRLNKLENANE